jgi:Ankyrin repeats (3 copies)
MRHVFVQVVLAAASVALSAAELSEADRALLSAARSGDVATVRRALREGANPNAALPSGWTPLMEAAKAGRQDAAEALLAAGALPDARDRAAGTALDVAQQAGHDALALLLRRHGARGSGKSVGDRVCVRAWKGSGFCGTVAAVSGASYLVDVTSVVGCEGGCAAEAECSSGREVGGASGDAVREGTSVRTKSWCLTHTGLE